MQDLHADFRTHVSYPFTFDDQVDGETVFYFWKVKDEMIVNMVMVKQMGHLLCVSNVSKSFRIFPAKIRHTHSRSVANFSATFFFS